MTRGLFVVLLLVQSLVAADGITSFILAVCAFPDDELVHVRALSCAADCALTSQQQTTVVGSGALDTLRWTLTKWSGHAGIQEHAILAINRMIVSNVSHRQRAVAGGFVDAVLCSMQAFSTVPGLHVAACLFLRSVVGNPVVADATGDELRLIQRTVDAGAVEAVVAAMNRFAGVASGQEHGCAFLHFVMLRTDQFAARLDAAGAVEAVHAAMTAFPQLHTLQAPACGFLQSMARLEDGRRKAHAVGVVDAVVAAMNTHPSEVNVQGWSCAFLEAYVQGDATRTERALAAGAYAALEAASKHATSTSTRNAAKQALPLLTLSLEKAKVCTFLLEVSFLARSFLSVRLPLLAMSESRRG